MKSKIEEKQAQVEALVSELKQAKTIVSFDYVGLSVLKLTILRKELRQNGCKLKIYKNNISSRAAALLGYAEFGTHLVGAKAICYSNTDPILPAKLVYDFAKKNPLVKFGYGVIEGVVASPENLKSLATIPSFEVLLSQLAYGLLQPVRELAIGLNMIEK
jgi:large subunit ribosomal protein L10